ncbi:hypothetical protein [Nocardioides rubriscoriae]|uniref:hypothetical protein n=1 Tax=Nocardioides rubriscoriae TaxID=642762 RepID=UPI0011DFB408|nr:hypothetical protein [Nocardioides rubriscoriae]
MGNVNDLLVRIYVHLLAPDRDKERGDVPGWVLITVMSATIVAALGAIAKPQLSAMLEAALNKVQ